MSNFIRIAPLSIKQGDECMANLDDIEIKIRQVLSPINIVSIKINSNNAENQHEAVVQLRDATDIQSLAQKYEDCLIPQLNNAQIIMNFKSSMSKEESNESNKKSSGSEDIQQLVEQIDQISILKQSQYEEPILSLTDPNVGQVVVFSNYQNCFSNVQDLRAKIKSLYQSVNRIIIKDENTALIEFQNSSEAEEIVKNGLQQNDIKMASIQDVIGFGENWIKKQTSVLPCKNDKQSETNIIPKTKEQEVEQINGQQQKQVKVSQSVQSDEILHQEILPKLNKITSMEAQFIKEQQKQIGTQENQYQVIDEEKSHQLIESRQDLENQNQFIFDSPTPIINIDKKEQQNMEPQKHGIWMGNQCSEQKKTLLNEQQKILVDYQSKTQFYWIMVAVGVILLLLF